MDPAPATTASAIIKWSAIFALAFTPLLSAAARSDGDSSTTEDLRIRPRPERGRRVGAAPETAAEEHGVHGHLFGFQPRAPGRY